MKAHELLDSPEKWTQRTAARDSENRSVHPDNPEACSFCLIGAICKCYNPDEAITVRSKVRDYLWDKHRHCTSIPDWNDDDARCWGEVFTLLVELDI